MSSIGDIILITPVVRQLRELYPDAQIDVLLRNDYAALLRFHPQISNLLLFDTGAGKAALGEMRNRIKANHYDVILDLHRNIRSYLFTLRIGVPRIYRVQKDVWLRTLLVRFKINRYEHVYGGVPGIIQKYQRTGAPIGLLKRDDQPQLFLSQAAKNKALATWKDSSGNRRIVIAPGARHFSKRWPVEKYIGLIQALRDDINPGSRVILVGGPDEREIAREIIAACPGKAIQNLVGKLTLQDTFALIAGCSVFISNDSGLMHAAAAFSVPQVAIFGSTTRELGFYPANSRAVVVENNTLSCRPCSHIGRPSCPKGHFSCMQAISVDQVLDIIRSISRDTQISGDR